MVSGNPEWAFYLFGESKKIEILKFLGVGMGGVLLMLQVWMSHKRAKAMETAAIAQVKATEQQARSNENAENGQRQERLKNAIEHLGHQSDSVRLGSAYELVHLAEDIEHFRQTVLDILCAHIRRTTGEPAYRENHRGKPSEEVQSLLTLLFVQKGKVFKDHKATLTESCLIGAELFGARLQEAHLVCTQLQGANLGTASLQGANLARAQLQEAQLWGAQLQGANLWSARLQVVNFLGAQLQGADLSETQLQGAALVGTSLQGANLARAQLQGANLSRASLQGADFIGAQLQGADLSEAQLQGANLLEASLEGADANADPGLPDITFEERIRSRIDQNSNLIKAMFGGGLSEEDVNSLVEGFDNLKANRLRAKLEPHIGLPPSFELPEGSGAVTGMYTGEDAEIWIAELRAHRHQ